jgi:type I restriction enzyme S subunit
MKFGKKIWVFRGAHIKLVGKVFFDRKLASTPKHQKTNHLSEWRETELGEVANIQTGPFGSQLKNEQYISGGTPVVTVEHIKDFRIIDFDFPSVTKEDKERLSKYLMKTGDILFTRVGSVDLSAFVSERQNGWIFSSRMLRVRPNNEINSRFLSYYFQQKSFREYILNISVGATMPSINTEILKSIPISYPPLPEQQAIAEVLSSLDDKIDLLHRQNKTLEALAETLFKQWFIEEADEKWEKKSLGELLTITSSKRIFYSEYVSSGIPFYRSKEIIELRNTGSTASELYITNERFNEIDSKFGSPREGDILMTSVGTLGVAYRVKANEKFYFKDGNITWFKDFKGLPSSVVYLWLTSKIGQKELSAITIGSTQQALTIEGLKSISFKIPPKEIVSACEKQFDDIISKIDSNQAQIHTLTQLRDTLLPKLMSGEVRVSAPLI